MTIVISWLNYDDKPKPIPEYLDIDPGNLDADSIENLKETKQWSPHHGGFVYWRVKCSLEEVEDGRREILVEYTESEQTDENIRNDIDLYETEGFFGKNRIIVERNSETGGNCRWYGENPKTEGEKTRWKAIGRPRLRVTREQWQRESRFRENVLAVDKRCVISGEETPEVLDAAHLVPVEKGGEDQIGNGFILRTDIHRLYDRGMFLINPKDGKLVVDDRNLSKCYKRLLLCHQGLPPATLERVKEALEERWKKPQP